MFLALILIEIIGLVMLGKLFGLALSLIWIIITFFLGLSILKFVAQKHTATILSGRHIYQMRGQEADFYLAIGAILLMLPGIISDFIGVCLLIYGLTMRLITPKPKQKSKSNVIDLDDRDYKERE